MASFVKPFFIEGKMDQRVDKIVHEFQKLNQWEGRYKHLISLGKDLEEMSSTDRVEENKVKGCQSQVWLSAHLDNGVIKFFGDSDASIVKGIVALLINVYDSRSPEEVLSLSHDFIDDIGLKQQLSMSRTNGLSSMLKQIQLYALAYKTKMSMGLT